MTLSISEGGRIAAPIDLFLKGSRAHKIELMFEQSEDVPIPLAEIITYPVKIVSSDKFWVVEVLILLFFGDDFFDFGVDI